MDVPALRLVDPSGLKVAVAADGDVWRQRPRSPALLRLRAAVAGLGAVWGGGQQLLVVAFVLVVGAFRGVLRGHEARILLKPGPGQTEKNCESVLYQNRPAGGQLVFW